jgi:hypothetical protein
MPCRRRGGEMLPKGCTVSIDSRAGKATNITLKKKMRVSHDHWRARTQKFFEGIAANALYVGGKIRPLPGETVPLRALERTELTCTATRAYRFRTTPIVGNVPFEEGKKRYRYPVAINGRYSRGQPKGRRHEVGANL